MTKDEFTNFYNQNIDRIFRYLFLRTNSLEIAQDLTADSFFKFWLFQEKGNKILNPRAFLFRLARNNLIDFYRQKKKNFSISLDELKDKGFEISQEDFLKEQEQDEEIKIVLKALKDLKPLYSEVIIYHYLENLSVKEIAFIFKKSENNIRVLIHRALKALKEKIG